MTKPVSLYQTIEYPAIESPSPLFVIVRIVDYRLRFLTEDDEWRKWCDDTLVGSSMSFMAPKARDVRGLVVRADVDPNYVKARESLK